MGKRLGPFGLPLERDQGNGILLKILVEDLQSNIGLFVVGLFLAQVQCLEHYAHSALAQHLLQHEPVLEDVADLQRPYR